MNMMTEENSYSTENYNARQRAMTQQLFSWADQISTSRPVTYNEFLRAAAKINVLDDPSVKSYLSLLKEKQQQEQGKQLSDWAKPVGVIKEDIPRRFQAAMQSQGVGGPMPTTAEWKPPALGTSIADATMGQPAQRPTGGPPSEPQPGLGVQYPLDRAMEPAYEAGRRLTESGTTLLQEMAKPTIRPSASEIMDEGGRRGMTSEAVKETPAYQAADKEAQDARTRMLEEGRNARNAAYVAASQARTKVQQAMLALSQGKMDDQALNEMADDLTSEQRRLRNAIENAKLYSSLGMPTDVTQEENESELLDQAIKTVQEQRVRRFPALSKALKERDKPPPKQTGAPGPGMTMDAYEQFKKRMQIGSMGGVK